MKPITAYLPWNGVPVRMLRDLTGYFGTRIGCSSAEYLPRTITLFSDPDVPEEDVSDFLDGATAQLEKEIRVRNERCVRFTAASGIRPDELHTFLTGRTHAQPWALYLSGDGGLGNALNGVATECSRGVIPCSTMRNHGVAWECNGNAVSVWLATARKEGQAWDWESDIGHESAHAAFAPVPLFVQSEPLTLSLLAGIGDLQPGHIARICYLLSEIAVVSIRGEVRETETHLPIADRDELFALLSLCHELDPSAGFERATEAARHVNGTVDPNEGDAIFKVAEPIVRLLPRLTGLTKAFMPPDLETFQRAAALQ